MESNIVERGRGSAKRLIKNRGYWNLIDFKY